MILGCTHVLTPDDGLMKCINTFLQIIIDQEIITAYPFLWIFPTALLETRPLIIQVVSVPSTTYQTVRVLSSSIDGDIQIPAVYPETSHGSSSSTWISRVSGSHLSCGKLFLYIFVGVP